MFDGEDQIVTEVSQNHWGMESNNDVLGVHITKQDNVTKIPRHIGSFYINVESLHISFTSIDHVSPDDFKDLEKLQVLDLYANKVSVIRGDLFANNPKLHFISFGLNPLEVVSRKTFDAVKNLNRLYLASSGCIDEEQQNEKISALLQRVAISCRSHKVEIDEIINSPMLKKRVLEIIAENNEEKQVVKIEGTGENTQLFLELEAENGVV